MWLGLFVSGGWISFVIPPRQKLIFPWCSQLPRFFASFSVRRFPELLYLPLMAQSRTKSFRYAGVCLVHCPGRVVTVGGGALTRGLLLLTGGTSSLFVMVVVSLVSPYEAPPAGGFCNSGSVSDPGSGGGILGAGGGGRTSKDGNGLSCLATSSWGVMGMVLTRSTASACQGPPAYGVRRPASPGGRPCLLA